MKLGTLTSILYRRASYFAIMLVAAAASFHGYYQKWHFAEADVPGDHSRASFESMVDGTAWRPYVYRQMLPAIADWIDHEVPDAAKRQLYVRPGSGQDAYLFAISDSPTANNEVYFLRYLALYAETFICALIAVCGMFLVCTALDFAPLVALFASVVLILMVPYFQSGGGFFYDYSELAFMATAVWVAISFDWWWILPVAALGAWNKESFLLFMPALYPLIRRRSPWFALPATCLLCLVCGAVYLCMRLRFAQNPGSAVEVWLAEQGRYLLDWRKLIFGTEETYGIRLVKAYTLLPMALLIWTVCRGWKFLSPAMQRHGQIAAAINIPLYLVFGYPGELRDLSMLYMTLLVIVATNATPGLDGVRVSPG